MIGKYLDISTAHIKFKDNQLFSEQYNDSCDPRIVEHAYGFIIFVPEDPYIFKETIDNIRSSGLSSAVVDILYYARKKGCTLINLDQDASFCKKLKTYDW